MLYLPAPFCFAATGGTEPDIQMIAQNPELSEGKSMNSDLDNTEIISKTIQSQLAAMLPTMIHETLAKKNLEGTASSFEHQFKLPSPVSRRVNTRLK